MHTISAMTATGGPAALHVTNGDIVVDLLALAGLNDAALARVDVLHEGPVPLVELDPPGDEVTAATRLRPTAARRRVLAGQADHVDLNGVDRWVGGVHLHGAARWRWDEGSESIVGTDA
jgi:hypothetical protein